jgi:hypothetical protein
VRQLSDYQKMICDLVKQKLSSPCGGLTGSSVFGEGTGGTHTAHGFLRLFFAQFELEDAIRAADPNDYRLASLASDIARSFLDIGCATGMALMGCNEALPLHSSVLFVHRVSLVSLQEEPCWSPRIFGQRDECCVTCICD